MTPTIEAQRAFQRGTAPLFALLTQEQTRKLAEMQGDPNLERRLSELAQRANEGELTNVEQAEYEGYIDANNVLTILQAEARSHLSPNEP